MFTVADVWSAAGDGIRIKCLATAIVTINSIQCKHLHAEDVFSLFSSDTQTAAPACVSIFLIYMYI